VPNPNLPVGDAVPVAEVPNARGVVVPLTPKVGVAVPVAKVPNVRGVVVPLTPKVGVVGAPDDPKIVGGGLDLGSAPLTDKEVPPKVDFPAPVPKVVLDVWTVDPKEKVDVPCGAKEKVVCVGDFVVDVPPCGAKENVVVGVEEVED